MSTGNKQKRVLLVMSSVDEMGSSQAAPIPTLSEWAMIMMASLMGMFAFVRIRRS